MSMWRGFQIIILSVVCFISTSHASNLTQHGQVDTSFFNFAETKNTDQKSHMDLNLKYNGNYSFSKTIKLNFSTGAYIASYPEYAFNIPEAEFVFSLGESSVRIGRTKVKHLSYLDTDWGLGVQTGFFRVNPLSPEEQGRVGLSYRLETDQIYMEFYGSPISIPDQFPGFKVSDSGKVTSDNPWSRLPPEKAILSTGAELNLTYDVVDDSLPDLLLSHQFGGALGVKTDYLEIVGMYSNRPSKQIDFVLDAKLQTGAESLVEIKTKPIFLREHFFGVQAKSQWFKNLTVKNGFYGLILQNDGSDDKYQTSHPDYFFIVTDMSWNLNKYKVSVQHLYSNERVNEKDDVIYIEMSRFLYTNSIALKFETSSSNKLKIHLGGVYSYKEKVGRVFLETIYSKTKNWAILGSLNLINSFGSSEVEGVSVASGIETYAALDSVKLGVSYAF